MFLYTNDESGLFLLVELIISFISFEKFVPKTTGSA
jgi:hypothetical protein